MTNRYLVAGSEADYEPDSHGQVLRNLLGISDPADMYIAEAKLLADLYVQVFDDFPESLSFQTIHQWHKAWLGNVYPWAGESRTVNMSKPDIHFAAATQIPGMSAKFETCYLKRFADLPDMSDEALVTFLAEMHVEFILIHPFREGNGRISRLLLDVMAVKAGAQPLDYGLWEQHKDYYFKAIQAGRDGDYQHVERLVRDVLNEQ